MARRSRAIGLGSASSIASVEPMQRDFVSVVITAFNRADVIARAIASVQAQTWQRWEIIVVDDASTDATAETVESSRWPKLRLIRNRMNRGIGGAKNVGILASRGDYVAFLDSDDAWYPEKLSKQVAALTAAPAIPLCFTDFEVERQRSGRTIFRRPRQLGSWRTTILTGEVTSLGSTLLARRSCFERVGLFDEGLSRMQDRDWILRYLDCYDDFLCVEEPLVRVVNTGWPDPAVVEAATERLLQHNRERLVSWGRDCYDLFRASLAFENAVAALRAGQLARVWPHLWTSLAAHPPFFLYLVRRGARKLRVLDLA